MHQINQQSVQSEQNKLTNVAEPKITEIIILPVINPIVSLNCDLSAKTVPFLTQHSVCVWAVKL